MPAMRAAAMTSPLAALPSAMSALLDGAPGAYRDTVILNAAAAFVVAGKAATLIDGAALARRAIDSGAAKAALDAARRRA